MMPESEHIHQTGDVCARCGHPFANVAGAVRLGEVYFHLMCGIAELEERFAASQHPLDTVQRKDYNEDAKGDVNSV